MANKVKVIDRGFKRIIEEIKLLDKSFVKVGVLSKAGSYGFTRNSGGRKVRSKERLTVASVATVHEFGSNKMNIPSRPFMRQSFDRNKNVLHRASAGLLNKIYAGRTNTKQALGKFGLLHQSQIQQQFTMGTLKALLKKTMERKGSSKPLVDTGRLRQSIAFEVIIK